MSLKNRKKIEGKTSNVDESFCDVRVAAYRYKKMKLKFAFWIRMTL